MKHNRGALIVGGAVALFVVLILSNLAGHGIGALLDLLLPKPFNDLAAFGLTFAVCVLLVWMAKHE